METSGDASRTFLADVVFYASRIGRFRRIDWLVYFGWVGLMLGLFVAICAFIGWGRWNAVVYPDYVWNVPVGCFLFTVAIAFDTIGHRTAYQDALKQGEALVHHITIAAGISSVLLLCLAYRYADACRIPAYCLVALSIFYSMIDEAMHWQRYFSGNSDRIEMWSHFFILLGHTIMIVAWCYWFEQGYPGVAETLKAWGGR